MAFGCLRTLGFRALGLGFVGLGCRALGLGFRVQKGLGRIFRIQRFRGLRALGLRALPLGFLGTTPYSFGTSTLTSRTRWQK